MAERRVCLSKKKWAQEKWRLAGREEKTNYEHFTAEKIRNRCITIINTIACAR